MHHARNCSGNSPASKLTATVKRSIRSVPVQQLVSDQWKPCHLAKLSLPSADAQEVKGHLATATVWYSDALQELVLIPTCSKCDPLCQGLLTGSSLCSPQVLVKTVLKPVSADRQALPAMR